LHREKSSNVSSEDPPSVQEVLPSGHSPKCSPITMTLPISGRVVGNAI
jgi:hypothetical protein